jgi:hypothetical protein
MEKCQNLRNNYPRPPPAKVSMNFRRGIVFILCAAAAEGELVYTALSHSAWYWLRSWLAVLSLSVPCGPACLPWASFLAGEFFSSCLRRVGRVCITMFINNANTPMQVWKSVLRTHTHSTRSWLTQNERERERAGWSLLTSLKFLVVLGKLCVAARALEPCLFCAITLRVSHCRQRRN